MRELRAADRPKAAASRGNEDAAHEDLERRKRPLPRHPPSSKASQVVELQNDGLTKCGGSIGGELVATIEQPDGTMVSGFRQASRTRSATSGTSRPTRGQRQTERH